MPSGGPPTQNSSVLRGMQYPNQKSATNGRKGGITPGGNNNSVLINTQLRKKNPSVEPPEIMVELDYKSKSSIGYQRLPMNNPIANKIRFKKNSSDMDDIILPTYGIGAQGEPYMKS